MLKETSSKDDEPPLISLEAVSTDDGPKESQPPSSTYPFSPWHDWRWQMRNRIRTVEELLRYYPDLPGANEIDSASRTFAMAITPYYASLIRELNPRDPVFRMSVPSGDELVDPAFLHSDPLEEDHDMPVPGLVHLYPDRALIITTSTCAVYCRHCTRKRVAGRREGQNTLIHLDLWVSYLKSHPEIHDVVLSGGDPFTLPTPTLERVLQAIRAVPSIDLIRIGTRTPVTLPMRITPGLCRMLKKYHPVWVNTHFNHPQEWSQASAEACARLVDAGVPLGNQTVLLKGINDDPRVMEVLMRTLVRGRVRPYYIFQCDLVHGAEHFRTPLSRGIEIMEYLRGRISGLAIPTFVVDAPGGGGKIPVNPNYIVSMSPTHTVLRNFEGMLIAYPEPGIEPRVEDISAPSVPSVWDLSTGRIPSLVPEKTARMRRRSSNKHRTSRVVGLK